MLAVSIISIGNELLTGLVDNTNAGYLSRRLTEIGILVNMVYTIPDNMSTIKKTLEHSLEESDMLILTGGLGPTDDDITKEAVAGYFNRPLILNKEHARIIEDRFSKRGLTMTSNNLKQALEIRSSKLINNDIGTAPGVMIEECNKTIILLPGPPLEMKHMFERQVFPLILSKSTEHIRLMKTFKCVGIGESKLETMIKEHGDWPFEPISYIARGGEIHLQLKASGTQKSVDHILQQCEKRLRLILGDIIYGQNDDTLNSVIVNLLKINNQTLSIAESCTGGLLSDCITDVPGCSKVFKGSIIPYELEAKANLIGIDIDNLKNKGAVNKETAEAMASFVKKWFKTDIGIGITGLAGPDNISAELPAGLVYIAIDDGLACHCQRLQLAGERRDVKEKSVQSLLSMLYHLLINKKDLR